MIDPSCTWFLPVLMEDNLVMIYTHGFFGWCGQPMVFGIISRALDNLVQSIIHGAGSIYVDDLGGFVQHKYGPQDLANVRAAVVGLLGENSMSDKSHYGVTGNLIGWFVNLETATIRPNDKGIRKLFYVFFFKVDIDARDIQWSLNTVQTISSLAERYSHAILAMRPFVFVFQNILQKMEGKGMHALRRPSSAAVQAVILWRTVALIMVIDPLYLEVPLRTFDTKLRKEVNYAFIVDAFQSVGMTISLNETLIGFTSYKLPFSATDSRFQNSREFLSFLLIIVVLRKVYKAPRSTVFSVKSDSMSALTWITDNKMSSVYGQVAFVCYTYAILVTGYIVTEATHIAGNSVEMANIDALSRDVYPVDLDENLRIDMTVVSAIDQLFALCNPSEPDSGELLIHHEVLLKVSQALRAVL